MRRHITRTLLAVAAAGATVTTLGFTAAGAATTASTARVSHIANPPSGGSPIYTAANCPRQLSGPDSSGTGQSDAPAAPPPSCIMSGYQASGRDFKFAQAVITVPAGPGSVAASPQLYVGLGASPTEFARAGIQSCGVNVDTCPNGWRGFYEVEQAGSPVVNISVHLIGVSAGDGLLFSVYFNQLGKADRFAVTLPDGTTYSQTVAVSGPVYTTAVAEADWTFATRRPEPVAPAGNTRLSQFLQGRFSTLSGQQGTFNGPWTLNPVEVTTNGSAPPAGTLLSAPAYLWTDGSSFNGLPGDAFGVWLYNP